MKNRAFFLFLFIGLLAACSPLPIDGQHDLYVDAQNSRATSEAAQAQAQFQERFLTATAEAPLIHITETAAAQSVAGTQAVLDRTATAFAWTPTISPTPTASSTPTPNLTATVAVAQVIVQQTQTANIAIRDNLQLDRERFSNNFYAVLPVAVFVIAALAFILGLIWISRRERYRPVPVDARGNILPMMDVVDGVVTDIDRNPNYRGEMNENLFRQWLRRRLNLPALLPPVTAERQDATTQRDQLLDLATRGLPNTAGSNSQANNQIKRQAGQEMTKQLSIGNLAGRFKVMEEGGEQLEVIDGEIVKVLDNDWKEANQK